MSTIAAILAFFFLDGTLRIVVISVLLLTDVFEIIIWLRWRKRRAATGAEGMIGKVGTALTDLAPEGRVKVLGQIWHAEASHDIQAGEAVEVTGTRGLRLEVTTRTS
jgi:membrane-bound serine protease (ClpP class)